MNTKSILIAAMLAVFTFTATAADAPPVVKPAVYEPDAAKAVSKIAPDVYKAGQFSLQPFATYRLHPAEKFDGNFGGGLAAGYSITRNLTIELEAISEGIDTAPLIQSITEAGANFKFYAPIKDSGFSPYALIGYTRDLKEYSGTNAEERGLNRMNAGLGVEYRYEAVQVFADGRWTHDLEGTWPDANSWLFRFGAGVHF